jgi:hypothetical protein
MPPDYLQYLKKFIWGIYNVEMALL